MTKFYELIDMKLRAGKVSIKMKTPHGEVLAEGLNTETAMERLCWLVARDALDNNPPLVAVTPEGLVKHFE